MWTTVLTGLLGQAISGSDKQVEEIKKEKDYTDVMLIGLLVFFLIVAGVGVYFISTKKA